MFAPWKSSNKPRQHIKKQRHHFADKGSYSHCYEFPGAMYRCESWIIKKAECQRIDAFKLRCWRRLLRLPWTAKRSNQSILKEINPEYSPEDWYWSWSSNPLATWCEEPTHWKRLWCWERLRAGGEGGDRGWVRWHHQLNRDEFEQTQSWWRTGKPGEL